MPEIRSPICTVLGHVDHGKSSLLDKIRGTAIVETEAGRITQAIGASIIPLEVIKKICGPLLEALNTKFTIPGLLFIDTPGHAAFTSLRKRGGSLADIAIVVIDVNEGFKPQTVEAIEILKHSKTPFIVAANKIDLIAGWQHKAEHLLENISKQSSSVQEQLDKRVYQILGELSKLGLNSERYDRVEDFTKQIIIVPVSAKTGEGIPELLVMLTGLAQRYLETNLKIDASGPAKGTILEVKEERGFGTTIDVIIYDGILKVNDIIVIGGIEKPIITKVKALLEPLPLEEMRDKKAKYTKVRKAVAATGVKIAAPDIETAIAGMPIRATSQQNLEKTSREIMREISEALIETNKEGIIVKADTLGSMEAMVKLLKDGGVEIRKAGVGPITRKDLMEAESNYEKDPLMAVVLGFNVKDESGLCLDHVKVIVHDIIYKLLEDLEAWKQEMSKKQELGELDKVVRPAKFKLMKGYVFRQNNPAVVGVEVEAGTIRTGMPVMNAQGKEISRIKSIQAEQENLEKAERGKQVAVSLEHLTVGRQIKEGDTLYSSVPEDDFRKLKEYRKLLGREETEVLKEIAIIMRKSNPVWGV
ncbi:MAG: translation initiation factor IF-2 [Candidatus Woesearchaeota archaeon]